MTDTSLPPTAGTLKDPEPILKQRIELLEGEVRMLHNKLQAAYRKLAELDGQDPQQAFDDLLAELKKAEQERLARELAEVKQNQAKDTDAWAEMASTRSTLASASNSAGSGVHPRRRPFTYGLRS